MPPEALGRLERIDLRAAWPGEAADFTPWLASEENISLLGEAIGLDLEPHTQECRVGPFRADILCTDAASQRKVLIENQIERTDHTHLGQLLTYAAGLEAVSIVWVAKTFTEEHRAALDWLNRITNDSVNFFGLEIELWRIGNSPAAPKFNVIVKPNEWSNALADEAQAQVTELGKMYVEYWSGLNAILEELKGSVRPKKPSSWSWMAFSVGRSDFWLNASIWRKTRTLGVDLTLAGDDRLFHFAQIRDAKEQIDGELGGTLGWEERPHKKQSCVVLEIPNCDFENRSDWSRQHRLLADRLNAFHRVFSPRVKRLPSPQPADTVQA